MIKTVLQKGQMILETPCERVMNFEAARGVVQDLIDTIDFLKTTHSFTRGIGLAAPQIGMNQKITVVEVNGKQLALINPKIIKKSDQIEPIREGCLSFFEYRAMVPRHVWVQVKAFDLQGHVFNLEGYGDTAMLLQHELDHLNGILYVSHLKDPDRELFRR